MSNESEATGPSLGEPIVNNETLPYDPDPVVNINDFKDWLKQIQRFGGNQSIEYVHESCDPNGEGEMRVRVYTNTNVYTISARMKETNYLGCVASTRKPRAGEHWTRGNDLLDGPLTFKTWYGILTDIIAYEAVKVHPQDPRGLPDE